MNPATPNATPLALQALMPAELATVADIPLEEARKVASAVHRRGEVPRSVPNVRRESLESVRARGHVPTLGVAGEVRSELDPFKKLVLIAKEGEHIETVRIPLEKKGRFSVCVSSQVGCALGCAFCATGRLGLLRNLEVWEVVEQVRRVQAGLTEERLGRVHGVVFQGMGEPLSNLDRVIAAARVLSEPCACAIDARAITVCTAGIPSGIVRLAQELPRVRLGLSLTSAREHVRASLMPIAAAHPLAELFEASVEHALRTGYSPLWAITLLEGINDTVDDARALAAFAHAFVERTGKRPRVSLVPYNATLAVGDPFRRVQAPAHEAFRALLRELGVPTHTRYSGGSDVGAACGQLAGAAAEGSQKRTSGADTLPGL